MALSDKFGELFAQVRDSEAVQGAISQVRTKYDELDQTQRRYVNYGIVGGILVLIVSTVLYGVGKVALTKSELADKEELITYLQQSADTIARLQAQQIEQDGGFDANSSLDQMVTSIVSAAGFDPAKIQTTPEKTNNTIKDGNREFTEQTSEVTMTQVNIRQVSKLLFEITDKGANRKLTIKNLKIDTKGDTVNGFLDSQFTISYYKAK